MVGGTASGWRAPADRPRQYSLGSGSLDYRSYDITIFLGGLAILVDSPILGIQIHIEVRV